MEIKEKEIQDIIDSFILARGLCGYSGEKNYEYFNRRIIKFRKKLAEFPEEFYCDCGEQISEQTLACAGMCDKCYMQSRPKTKNLRCTTKLNHGDIKEFDHSPTP